LKRALEQIAAALGRTVPPDLAAIVSQLGQSAWPEMVERWSRLTPTGFPIEFTVIDADPLLRWTSEIAGPEIADSRRLGLVARYLALAGQPVPPPLLAALQAAQQGRDLRYGAWLGGRAIDGARSRFKLYAEIPAGVSCHHVPLPPALRQATAHAPHGTRLRMLGIEPARGRMELYLRLPTLAPDDLRPLLSAAGHVHGFDALACSLPDGTRRLAGRRLGISLAIGATGAIEVALFVSARTLFPAAPEMLHRLVPALANLPEALVRPTLVTLRLDPHGAGVACAVGVTGALPSSTPGMPRRHAGAAGASPAWDLSLDTP
jgi:hypothetical protein